MRALFNRIVLPLIVGALMLGSTWTVVGVATGAWPAILDLSDWSTDAAIAAIGWLVLASWALGCGPAYMLRRWSSERPAAAPFMIEDEFGVRAILSPDGKGDHTVRILDED